MPRRTPNHLSQMRSRAVARRRRLGLERLDERLLLNVDWRNPADSLDVNGDGQILPLDALLVINDLNFVGPRRLPAEHTEGQPYFDSSGDQSTAPLDALLVINAVNNGVSSYRVLREGTQLATDSSVTITLGQSSGTRSYRVAIEADFGSDPPQVAGEDTLVVYLVDPAAPANTLLDRQTPGTSLFTLTGDRADYVPGLVQWDGAVLQIDLSSVTTRTTGELKFQLLNGDSDTNARITLKPLSNVADPEGLAPPRLWPDAVAAASDSSLNLAGLQDGGSAQVVWDNVRYQETTGRYLFDLRVDNPGTVDLGRTLAVAFPGLPAGVTLLQAAGTTAAGAPYLNLSPLTPPGGLARGQFSQRVVVELANPTGVSFVLQPVVLAGVNRAPVFDPVGPLTVSPGGVLAVRLSASDPDGDRVTFALGAGQRPTGTLRADGLMTFRPELDEVGHYSFSLVASDGRLNAARTVEIDVVADPDPVTRISGWVQRIDGGPLEGVPVEIAGFSSTTDATGHFVIALPTMKTPTESFPIAIPADDPFLDPFHTGDQQIRFRRSRYDVTTGDSVVNPRQHPNLVSSFLDASMVYGATPERAAALRTLAGGRLKTSAGELLPLNDGATFPAGTLENDNEGRVDPAQLFVSGDVRTNENVPLIALHTVLLREHNRLADEIAAAHPELSDEAIYQQARQLVGALIQQITYSEYLPLLLGPNALPAYSGYDPQVNPGESELFATAAFRVGHTQLFSEIQRLDADGLPLAGGSLTLREAFFTPQPIQQDGIEPYLRGLAASQAEQTDIQIIDDVRNFLFGPPGSGGMDLAAMNIQRGRDVGLPSYNQARVDFGLPPVTSFAEITSDVAAQQALGSLYGSVDDIDVWVGGIAEDHAPDALVGPLFQAIIGDQFRRTRDGDRFWYENGQLTDAQLDFVRGTTLSGLIQRNTSITGLPDHVFTQGLIPSAPAPAGSAASVPATEFRSYDGSGNHATQTDWGTSSSLVLRNFTNGYGDGISTPGGANRPGPREISNAAIAQDVSNPDSAGSTGFLVFWGQIIDHDLGLTPGGVSDTLKILGNLRPNPTGDDAYPFVAERMDLMLDHPVFPGVDNVIARPIYLPHLDLTNGQVINPNVDTMVTTASIPAAALQVNAGNLHNRQGVPYAGVLSITEVPTGQTPAALPPGMSPDLVVTIQPADLVFSTPAPLTLPNRSGAPAGTSLDLWSINPITGTFDVVGEGVVSNDGTQIQTVSGGIRNSSWQFFLPRPEQLNELRNNVRNQKDDCVVCRAAAGFTSDVEAHSGAVIETHALVSYRSLEDTRQVVLTYDSQRADPRPIVHFDYANLLPGSGRLIYATATVSDGSFTYQVPGFQAPQAPTDFHDLRIVAGCPPWDLGGGSVHDGSCTVNGSSDFTISGTAGQVLGARSAQERFPGLSGLTLTSPSQVVLSQTVSDDFATMVLPETGTYRVHVHAGSDPRNEFVGYGIEFLLRDLTGYGLRGGENFWTVGGGGAVDGALQADLRSVPTGHYQVQVQSGLGTILGHEFRGVSAQSSMSIVHVNGIDSPFGAGWGIAGWQQAYEQADGSVLIVDGDGSQLLFLPVATAAGQYQRPLGDFSNLQKNQGAFRRTLPDQTVYQFDVTGRLATVTDRQGNVMRYEYDGAGRLAAIVDPVGLSTHFAYSSGHLSTITDPANRVTRFSFDAEGNLTSVTDPDGATRTWRYDSLHHMIGETDQLGQEERTTYDFAGRAVQAVRKDGSVIQVDPLQTQFLLPSERTIDPLHAPPMFALTPPHALVASPNGNVRSLLLDRTGQAERSSDAEGNLGGAVYDPGTNLLLQSSNARGNTTDYSYDDRGNLLAVRDAEDAGDSLDSAKRVDVGTSASVRIHAAIGDSGFVTNDVDLYRVSLTAGDFLTATVEAFANELSKLDSVLRIFDESGNELARAQRGLNPLDAGFKFRVSATGEYLVGVSSAANDGYDPTSPGSGSGGTTGGEYQLVLARNEAPLPTAILASDVPDQLDQARATVVASGSTTRLWGTIGDNSFQAADVDLFRIPLAAGDRLTIGRDVRVQNTIAAAVRLFDAAGNELVDIRYMDQARRFAEVDYDPTAVVYVVREAGDYFVGVSGRGNEFYDPLTAGSGDAATVQGAYELQLSVNVAPAPNQLTAADVGGLLATAFPVTLAPEATWVVSSEIGDGGTDESDVDLYALQLTQGDRLTIDFSSIEEARSMVRGTLRLFDASGTLLGENTPYYGSPADLSLIAPTTGTYYLGVSSNGNGDYNPVTGDGLGSGTDRGPYLLRLATNVPRPNEYLLGNQGAEVGDVLASAHLVTFTSGQIFTALSAIGDSPAAADDVDLYRLELAAGDILTFGLDGAAVGLSEVDGPVRLFDSAGQEVNAAYDLVPGVDASFYVRQGGTYYLGVSGGIGDYDPATTVGRSGGFRTGPYVLVVGVNTEARPDRVLLSDVGDTFATADPLTLSRGATTVIGSTIGGTPAGRNDVDLYSLDLVKGDRVTIHVDSGSLGLSQISAYIRAFDPAGQPLWETPSGNNFRTVGLTFLARSSGRHTIGISAFGNNAYDPTVAGSGGNGDGEGDYRLTISRNVAPAADVVAAGSGAFGERRMTYDSQFNQPTSYTDEMGRTVTYTLDPIHGNVLVQRRIVGQDDSVAGGSDDAVTQFTYNARGQVLTRTDPLGHVTENRYDALGRLERVIYDVGGAEEAHVDYAYDAAGNVVQRTDETGAVTVFEYDAHNRVTRMQEADPDGAGPLAAPVTTWTYDARGHTVGSTDAGGRTATLEYDELDRVVRQIDSANQATRYHYDVGGALTAIIDPLGLRTTLVYDTRQRLREVREPNGAVTRYRYDADNHRIELVDAAGNRTRFEYDARGRLVRETDPLLGVTEYVYNGANDLIGETDRNGRQRQYAFDDLGRMTSETWVGTGTVLQYGYDKLGNLLSASDANSQLTWTYTRRNFVDSADSQGPAGTPHVLLDYGYDAAGHVVSLADTLNGVAGGVEQSTYDALHRLVRVTQTVGGTGRRVDLAYNAAGQFTSLQRYQDLAGTQLAVSTNYTYDSAGRLASLGHTAGGQSAALYQFQYDAASRITQWTQDGTPQVLAYDANDQLLTVTPAGSAATERYTYDANGNRTGAGVGGTGTRSTGPANRLQSDGRYSYTYDADGNLIRRTELASGASTEYTWDFRNRLTAVTRRQADNTFVEQVEYRYDALDRRIRRTVQDSVNDATPEITHYVHDRDRVLLEMTGNGGGTEASRRYLHGPAVDQVLAQQDAGGGFEWLLADHVGTVRDVVEENGSTQSFAYDTFGRTTSPPAVDERRIGFAGHELDPVSGLYDFRARYYDAETGRFLSEDPLRWASGEENLYRYAANSPVLYVDPYGLEEAPPAQSAQFPTPVVVAQQAGNYYSNLPYAQQEQLKDAGVNAAQQTANTFFPGNDWFKPSDSKCKVGLNASGIGASYQTGNGTVTAGYNGDANVGYSTSNYSVGAGINPSTGTVTVGGAIPIGK